jgi:hypothetical protein
LSPEGEKQIPDNEWSWARRVFVHWKDVKSHSLALISVDDDARRAPEGEKTTAVTDAV